MCVCVSERERERFDVIRIDMILSVTRLTGCRDKKCDFCRGSNLISFDLIRAAFTFAFGDDTKNGLSLGRFCLDHLCSRPAGRTDRRAPRRAPVSRWEVAVSNRVRR